MYLLIGADLVPTKSNRELFALGDVRGLIGSELLTLMEEAAYRIINLEVPLADQETPIKKCGPNLCAPTASMVGYAAMGVNLVTLANNHVLDQDVQGLRSTCSLLRERGIPYLGAGSTLEEASRPYIFRFHTHKIGVYACVEHEFSCASAKRAGANPFEPLETPDQIKTLKEQCDYVIVLYHGGKEHYRYPSPGLQKVCRKLVEKGADLVVCQHSHCIGCEEDYLQGKIIYGQGNFLFDYSDIEEWQTGMLIRLSDDLEISYVPLVKHGCGVRMANSKTAKEIMEGFWRRSERIKDEAVVKEEYERFAKLMEREYLSKLLRDKSFFAKLANRLTCGKYHQWILKRSFSEKTKNRIRNYIECESHQELLVQILKQ